MEEKDRRGKSSSIHLYLRPIPPLARPPSLGTSLPFFFRFRVFFILLTHAKHTPVSSSLHRHTTPTRAIRPNANAIPRTIPHTSRIRIRRAQCVPVRVPSKLLERRYWLGTHHHHDCRGGGYTGRPSQHPFEPDLPAAAPPTAPSTSAQH